MGDSEDSRLPELSNMAWPRVKELFLAALDVPDSHRAVWLQRTCGDDLALRHQLESLLAHDASDDELFDTPAAALLGSDAFEDSPAMLAPGAKLGPYRIISLIASGGMGDVYRARDTRSEAQVAIKTARATILDPDGAGRLSREARHASTLSHPNICAIHTVGSVDGVHFIAMELVDGPTLRDLLRTGPVGLDRALGYGIDIAGALAHAHLRGVVHRDLKSSNVAIDPTGRAVVLDFGLSTRLPGAAGSDISGSLIASDDGPVGTLSYMPPELLLGKAADGRSDLWSLGVLLYQLVAGDLPFRGETPFATSSAILAESPRPLSRSVPLSLRLIIERCLAKEPGDRYRDAASIRNALVSLRDGRRGLLTVRLALGRGRTRRHLGAAALAAAVCMAVLLASGASSRPIGAIAILPLTHGSTAADEVYASGIADALVARLGALTNLRVIARDSAVLAANGRSSGEAARQLGADAAIRGRVSRTAQLLHLDLELVAAESGDVLWSASFQRRFDEALVLQAEAVRALVNQIDPKLRPEAVARLALVPTVRPEAYEAYLKGRFEWNRRTRESLQRAIDYFQRSIDLDPTHAAAHAGLADSYNQLGTVMVGSASPRATRPKAEAAAIKALQVDPDSAEAHAALGYVWHYSWRWSEAESEFRRAIELNPAAALPRIWYANLLMSRGRFDEALQQAYAARDIDPFSLVVMTNIGWIQFYAGRPGDALDALARAVALDGSYPQARWRLADVLSALNRRDEAIEQAEIVLRLTGRTPSSLANLASVYARAGRRREAERLLAEALAHDGYISPGMIAPAYVDLGEYDMALNWIERTCDEQANAAVYLAVVPWARPLRSHPRFQAVLRRIDLQAPLSR